MKLHLPFHHKKPLIKEKRFNPHRFWIWVVGSMVMLCIVAIALLSWYYLWVTNTLDAPATPTLATNASTIRDMQRRLDAVDAALKERVGQSEQ